MACSSPHLMKRKRRTLHSVLAIALLGVACHVAIIYGNSGAFLQSTRMFAQRASTVSACASGSDNSVGSQKVVLWLHGLGDTGAGWEGVFSPHVLGVNFHHPTAPIRSVTCNGGMSMTSWFDIESIPVCLSEPEQPRDFDVSVTDVQRMLEDFEKKGVPSRNIVLGGFSQGGAISLAAGLSYPRTLGGIVSISGWCVNRQSVHSWISEAGKDTPVLMCCGDGDPVVDFSLTKKSADLVKEVLGEGAAVLCPKRPMHQPAQAEVVAVVEFLREFQDA